MAFKLPRLEPKKFLALTSVIGGMAMSANAWALPSFARQTGWSCATCHTSFPQLTPMGRMFSLMGFTTTNLQPQQKIEAKVGNQVRLFLPRISQFSVFVQASATNVAGGQKVLQGTAGTRGGANSGGATSNNDIQAPQQVSLFYAGALSTHVGDFMHLTYGGSGTGGFGFDDSAVVHTHAYSLARNNTLIVGEDVNNTPTFMDVWNTSTDWNSPFYYSDYTAYGSVPTSFIGSSPGAAFPLIGVGAYVADIFGANRANWLYFDADVYHNSEGIGSPPNGGGAFNAGGTSSHVSTGQMQGNAPYIRFAYQHDWANWNWEIGTYDMWTKLYVNPTAPSGAVNQFDDYDLDSQLQYLDISDNNNLTLRVNYIHEVQKFADPALYGDSSVSSGHLNTMNLSATYWWHDEWAAQGGFQDTNGTANALYWGTGATANGGVPLWSANGSPDSTDEWVEASYLPWWNMRFSVRYTMFNKFRGLTGATATTPSASKFNTVELLAWFSY